MFRFLRSAAVGLLVVGCGAAAIGIVAGAGASASTAGAVGAVSLPSLSSLHEVLVDTSADKGAGYIFYSEGQSAGALEERDSLAKSGVIVTTLNGSYVKTLESGNGTEGIALSADGSTLYAATATGIAAINANTLATENDVPLVAGGGTLLPYDLAVQGGDLWISYLAENADGDTVGNGIGGLSLADIASGAGAALTPTQLSGPTWSAPPSLAADPQESGALAAVEDGSSPPLVATYNVDSATPDMPVATSTTAAVQFVNCPSAGPATILPGGTFFWVSCDGTETEYNMALFREGTVFGGLPFSAADGVDVAATTSSSRNVALGTSVSGTGNLPAAQVGVYEAGGGMLNIFSFVAPDTDTRDSVVGLGWGSTGSTLYAVVEETSSAGANSYALDVLPDANRAASALTLGGTSKAAYGTAVSISGRLTFSAYGGLAATTVTVTRTHAGGSTVSLGKVTGSTANGTFSFKDTTALSPGTWIYTVSYAGTVILAPSKATRTVIISKAASGATLTASATDVKAGATVHLTVKLPKTAGPARTIDLYATPAGQSKKLVKSAKVGPRGQLEIAYKIVRRTLFSVVVAGDSDFYERTFATTIGASAK
jgi:hypothetical protein